MIKGIIFDVGGVLHTEEMKHVHRDIADTLGISRELEREIWDELDPKHSTGKITEEEFWQEFLKKSNAKKPLPRESLLAREQTRRYTIIAEVIDLVKALKALGYKLAILSNTIKIHADINKKAGLYKEFPLLILSYEVGLRKPDPQIFKLALEKLETEPEETIYIDDKEENVEAARNMGINSILFQNSKQLKQSLADFNVLGGVGNARH